MLNTAYTAKTIKNKVNIYQKNEILSSSPEKLVLFLYDQAIAGCKSDDERKASRAIAQLIDSLDFNYPEIATGVFRLYEYSIRMIREKNFHKALPILVDLRSTWAEALQKQKAA